MAQFCRNSVQAVPQFGREALFGPVGQHGTIWTSDSPSVRVEGGKVYQSGGTNTESIPANRKDFRPSQWSVIGTLNTARNAPRLYLQNNIGAESEIFQ